MSEVVFYHHDSILGGYILCCVWRSGLQEKGGKGTLEEQITEEYLKKVVIIHWAQGMLVLLV